MKLSALKKMLTAEAPSAPEELLVFVCDSPGARFLAEQYTDAICSVRKLGKSSISSLKDVHSALNAVFSFEDRLFVLRTDEFAEEASDLPELSNVVVICDKVGKKLSTDYSESEIEIKAPVAWQVAAYIQTVCPGISDADAAWLANAVEADPYKADNEASKAALFDKGDQPRYMAILKSMTNNGLYKATAFQVADALAKGDMDFVADYLRHSGFAKVDAMAVVALLLQNFKKILLLNFNSGATWQDLGITSKQASAVKYYYRNATLNRTVAAMEFLSNIDRRLKTGMLDMPKDKLLDYVVCRLLAR